ncbi:DUF6192 family protein [Streptomyces sp. NPDC092369]|uniref:DUF6192 family protein n=1 Tax=Streptomyces sp. NPDC092369 TaxID=3366015 RepID=UPI003822F358
MNGSGRPPRPSARSSTPSSTSTWSAPARSFVATLGRLVPQLRGQEFTNDERETVRRQIGRVRAAADWLEGALDNGEFTLDEQLAQLLKGE